MVVLCVFHAADFNKSEQSTLSLSDFSVSTGVFSSVCSSMFWESWESAACLARLLRSVYGLSWAAWDPVGNWELTICSIVDIVGPKWELGI